MVLRVRKTANRSKRRAAPLVERLEIRLVLSSSIDIDAAGALTVDSDDPESHLLRISVSDGIYTKAGGRVVLGEHGSTVDVRHQVGVGNRRGGGEIDVSIDDSADTGPTAATLGRSADACQLTGFAPAGGSLVFEVGIVGQLTYRAPSSPENTLSLDLDGLRFLPNLTLHYDGEGAARARLVSVPYNHTLPVEVHTAGDMGVGSVFLTREIGGTFTLNYQGLTADGLEDWLPVTDYVFLYAGTADPGVLTTAVGPSDWAGKVQGLKIASNARIPAFTGMSLANKTNVMIRTNGTTALATSVEYASEQPVPGLASLSIVTSPNDAVDVIATPPGAAFAIETSAAPRPAPIPPSEDPTTAGPPPEQPSSETPPAETTEPPTRLRPLPSRARRRARPS